LVVVAALTPALAAAKATSDDEQAAASSSLEFNEKDDTLNIEWSGPILPGMADYLRAALDTYATPFHRVVLFLDSVVGQVEESDRVIHVLGEIKQTHRLITTVLNDKV
jgi:membrane-bound ClpP family serine protease